MTGIEEDILLLDSNPEDIILHEAPITDKTITTIEVTAWSQDVKVHPDFLSGDLELHPHHPVEIETDVLATDNLVFFTRECPEKDTLVAKVQPREETSPRHKDDAQLYGGDPEKEEEVMAAMCYSDETCSVIQPNRVHDVCSQ